MALDTIIYVCSCSVPWELDERDKKIITKHQNEPIKTIIQKLWTAAQKG